MLISRVWLKELLADAAGFDLGSIDDDGLTRALTGLGLEVEAVRATGAGLSEVVIADVAGIRPHPEADKLRIVDVSDGNQNVAVVCGAANVPAPGGKVLWARPGAVLPDGTQIGHRLVRGVSSPGMLCSETELDIGPDGDGIVVLPGDAPAGRRLVDFVPAVMDTIIELSITPNRPDALGHVGVARDLAVKLNRAWRPSNRELPECPEDPGLVELRAPDRCGRYLGVAFVDARIGPSPLALRLRLHRLGLRPLSNVVDVTNLVMMQWGQPLHAFDRARLRGGKVVVRTARPGEPIVLLDGRTLALAPDDLVIADSESPMALAGVMGGEHSGVAADTTTLLLEAAWFEPAGIRRSARARGCATDSSHRFERGVDHGDGLTQACASACALLQEVAGAKPVAHCYPIGSRPAPRIIDLRPARTKLLLGMEVPQPEAKRILVGVGVLVDDADAARWRCTAPSHRPDLEREVDLIDEIVRHHGLDRLPMQAAVPHAPSRADRRTRARADAVRGLADALREAGLHEHVAFAFTRPEAVAAVVDDTPNERTIVLANPMRGEASVLRTHLLGGLLEAVAVNLARHGRAIELFEIGRVYRWPEHTSGGGPKRVADCCAPAWTGKTSAWVAPKDDSFADGPDPEPIEERTRAAVVRASGSADNTHLDARSVAADLLGALLRLGYRARTRATRRPVPWLHPGAQAEIVRDDGTVLGRYGLVHPEVLEAFALAGDHRVAYGELWLEHISERRSSSFVALPRFPATSRDASFDIVLTVPSSRILEIVDHAARLGQEGDDPPRVVRGDRGDGAIEIIDDYRGEEVAAGRRALTLRLHYRAQARSVTDAEVQAVHLSIITRVCDELRSLDPDVRTR